MITKHAIERIKRAYHWAIARYLERYRTSYKCQRVNVAVLGIVPLWRSAHVQSATYRAHLTLTSSPLCIMVRSPDLIPPVLVSLPWCLRCLRIRRRYPPEGSYDQPRTIGAVGTMLSRSDNHPVRRIKRWGNANDHLYFDFMFYVHKRAWV